MVDPDKYFLNSLITQKTASYPIYQKFDTAFHQDFHINRDGCQPPIAQVQQDEDVAHDTKLLFFGASL